MKSLLFACTVALLLVQCSCSLQAMRAKLGQTTKLELGHKVTNVSASLPNARLGEIDRKNIVKDGLITDYGLERYGGRLSFRNGTLIIKDLKADDQATYFFAIDGNPKNPAAIDLIVS